MALDRLESSRGTHAGLRLDAAVALVLCGLLFATLKMAPGAERAAWGSWLVYASGAACTLPLALRRRAPLTVLAVVTAGVIAFQVLQPMNLVVPLAAVALAVYTAGVHGRPGARDVARAAVAVTLLGLLLVLFLTVDAPGQAWPPRVALYALLLASAWVGGEQTRRGAERERELAARTAELQLERERSAQQAATEERLRIARELHDVLGHHVSMMAVQAGGAQRVLRKDPERADHALEVVQSAAHQAIQEMQRVLALLRKDDAGGSRPVRQRLVTLVADVRAAGLDVAVDIDGLPALPASLDLAVTRVVQEALTNVLRHAGAGAAARVHITRRDDTVSVLVDDDGPAEERPQLIEPPAPRGGRGLLGLRERVELHGGRFDAGPGPAGGFRVQAVLPLDAE